MRELSFLTIMRKTKGNSSVFIDCGFAPAEAENLRVRAEIMIALQNYIEECGLTKRKAASLMGVPAAQITDLLRGHIENFSVGTLFDMLAAAGLRVELRIKSRKFDCTFY